MAAFAEVLDVARPRRELTIAGSPPQRVIGCHRGNIPNVAGRRYAAWMRKFAMLAGLLFAPACGTDEIVQLAPELGTGDRTPTSVTFTPIAEMSHGLNQPRDLAFNPLRPEELWVASYTDDSMLIITGAPGDGRTYDKRIDGYALHFMEQVTSLAFGGDNTTIGKPGTFGTCGESRNTYNGQGAANDFTGPTLWSSDLTVFAKQDPNGLGSHLDMLHNTPLCMGIAHEADNKYWVFNGLAGSIDRYDFVTDDGIGNDSHGDGLTWRYSVGEVKRVENVPSHLAWDAVTSTLYIADSGNGRIAKLDGTSGSVGMVGPGPETPIAHMTGGVLTTVTTDLLRPSGIELYGDLLYVTDNAASHILAFDLDGVLVNYLETGLQPGTLGGLAFGPDGKLYFADMKGNRILRVDP
jgi:DNA-binding beta-propeller fold protein YncE